MAKKIKRYMLLIPGYDIVEDGDEEYSTDELMDKYPEPKWRPVTVNFVGEYVQEDDPPVRRLIQTIA